MTLYLKVVEVAIVLTPRESFNYVTFALKIYTANL